MRTIVGIFPSYEKAKEAVSFLLASEIPAKNLTTLAPQASLQQVGSVPTTAGEQPGMGAALGGVAGSAVGLAGGVIGTSLLLPGVGPIIALGAALLSGLTGAAAGAAAGDALETSLVAGLPPDEVFIYEDALRHKRSVVIALAEDASQEDMIRQLLTQNGAESLDAAREQWWLGLRDTEEQAYGAFEGPFEDIERTYRQGFEAALSPRLRGQSYAQATETLRELYPGVCLEEPFRHGYDRGQAHYHALLERHDGEVAEATFTHSTE
jgi:hypothetical protein